MVRFNYSRNVSLGMQPSYQSGYILRLAFMVLIATGGFSNGSTLKWHHSYSEALAEAKQSKKPIFLAFR